VQAYAHRRVKNDERDAADLADLDGAGVAVLIAAAAHLLGGAATISEDPAVPPGHLLAVLGAGYTPPPAPHPDASRPDRTERGPGPRRGHPLCRLTVRMSPSPQRAS